MTDFVAMVLGGEIRLVGAERNMIFGEILQDFFRGKGKKRSQNPSIVGRNARQTFQARTACEVQEQGFGIVVGVMGDANSLKILKT